MTYTVYVLLVYSDVFDSPIEGIYSDYEKAEERMAYLIQEYGIDHDLIYIERYNIID